MFIIWDKVTNRPFDKWGYGHFKVYATKVAAMRYLYSQASTARCEVREVSHVAFTEGGFI
jgi:hypothetical protein